jgi:hypothetical protein
VSEDNLQKALNGISAEDLTVDPEGRIVINNPELAGLLSEAGPLADAAKKKSDTNIICCGNGSCRAADDLGALVERFTGGQV